MDTKQVAIVGGASVISLAVGALAGYKYAVHSMVTHYEEQMEREIDHTKRFYAGLHKVDEFATPADVVLSLAEEKATQALKSYQGDDSAIHVEETEEKSEVVNIFVNSKPIDPNFDWEQEEVKHTNGKPFVITFEEYFEEGTGQQTTTLTYYKGDDVLAEENDEIIADIDEIVGTENLQCFGHGSNDPRVVYIRNLNIGVDFEVALDDRKYEEIVLGYFEHSESTKHNRRFRGDDG